MSSIKSPPRPVEPWQEPDARPFVEIQKVTRKYGDVYAVDDVSLSIYRGEFFSLLGPSGCGKTTLLMMLAGLEQPSAGRILIDGVDMTRVPAYERPVNMMFQSYALFPHMSVEQNVAFGLKQEGRSRGEIRDRVAAMLELVHLSAQARRKPDQLSGGQRQRVALARALAKNPKLLLLDEPLAALDRKLRESTQFELVNIQEKIGTTFVMVTHDQEEAMTMSSRIAVMNEGGIRQVGTPAALYEYPASRFVAQFIGSVNLFEGRVLEERNGLLLIQSEAAAGPLLIEHREPLPIGTPVSVAIRPEKIQVVSSPPADGLNYVQGTVDEIAYLGGVSHYLVIGPGGKSVRVQLLNAGRSIDAPLTWYQQATLAWQPSAGAVLTR